MVAIRGVRNITISLKFIKFKLSKKSEANVIISVRFTRVCFLEYLSKSIGLKHAKRKLYVFEVNTCTLKWINSLYDACLYFISC